MSGKPYTETECATLVAKYATTSVEDLAAELGRSTRSIYNQAYALGLKKDTSFIAHVARENALRPDHGGRKSRFGKGHISFNKGKKWSEFMSPEGAENSRRTCFKKGNRPANWKPIGSTRVNVEGYIEVKIREGLRGWDLMHRVVWEAANGPIRKAHKVQFRDGNRQNVDINNLYLISNADQLRNENSFHARYPEEVKQLIHLKSALKRQLNNKEREQQHG